MDEAVDRLFERQAIGGAVFIAVGNRQRPERRSRPRLGRAASGSGCKQSPEPLIAGADSPGVSRLWLGAVESGINRAPLAPSCDSSTASPAPGLPPSGSSRLEPGAGPSRGCRDAG